MRIAWANTHGQYPDSLAQGESVMYMADIVEDGRHAETREHEAS